MYNIVNRHNIKNVNKYKSYEKRGGVFE